MRHLNRLPRRSVPTALGLMVCGLFAVATPSCPAQAPKPPAQHPLTPFLRLTKESRDAIAAVRDYEALFTKRELVGRTMYTGQMAMKLRHQPFGVYLRFVDANRGREVIYAGPRYRGQLQAHEPPGSIRNIVGTLSLDPMSSQAMAEGRHPITQIGMLNMVEALLKQWNEETKYGEIDCQFYPNAKLQGTTECQVCESTHPVPRRQFPFHRTRLYIDKKTNFPVRLEQWGFPPTEGAAPYLIEEYTYTDVKPNAGLTDGDFDIRNRRYHF
ncbi:MAG TPA: DUF1571 domain-containing protein [Planctomycetaceae bacterium]|jgi:hypothetical protein|nr:DUF1571 domain-containing protein [Planctomycetaceae bacterium]